MMLLYVCPACGKWQDQSLAEAVGRALSVFSQALSGKKLDAPSEALCPDGHGAMTLVESTDKLFAWPKEPEQTKHNGSLDAHSQDEGSNHAIVDIAEDYMLLDGSKLVYLRGGYGDIGCCSISLDASQALSLLAWLEQKKTALAQMIEDVKK